MSFTKNNYWLLALTIVISACFPEEVPVERKPRLNASSTIDAGPSRDYVSFFSLEEGKVIAQENPMNWDIYADERGVFINGFRSMQAASFQGAWDQMKDTTGLKFRFLAMDYKDHMWLLHADTQYVIRLGLNNNYEQMPAIKFRYVKSTQGYEILTSPLSSNDFQQISLESYPVYYSLQNNKSVNLPDLGSYDIVFGRYTDFVTFVSQSIDYLVFGALQGTARAVQIMKPFDEVTVLDFDSVAFPQHQRGIGWDWKYYSIDNAAYSVREDRCYLVQTQKGYKYKLRFVNFYNAQGVSGHPTFEYTLF